MSKRRAMKEREVLYILWRQYSLLCYRCRGLIHPDNCEREHLAELALGGKDEPENCAYSHRTCHSTITNGTPATVAGSSKHRIGKVRRLRGENKPKVKRQWASREIPSRPFPKRP